MNVTVKFAALAALLLCAPVSMVSAENPNQHDHTSAEKGVEHLSPALRDLLTQEMKAIQEGMMSIIPAYASGDWHTIQDIGAKIQHSYILKQRLTPSQKEELHQFLPAEFLQLDQQFHSMAGMLSHAAENKKSELVGFYFSRMGELCVSCHSKFASHKFSHFLEQPHPMEQHSH